MKTLDQPMSLEGYYALPADGQQHELVGGFLVTEPRPNPRHGQVMARVTSLLNEFVDAHDLGTVLAGDAGFLLARDPATLRGPDVAFVRKARWEAHPRDRSAFEGAPDLAVEILSPSNHLAAVRGKVADYLAAGASLVWVVDPMHDRVTVYQSLLAPRNFVAGDEVDGGDLLPGFRARVDSLLDT